MRTLIRQHQFRPMTSLRHEIDRLFSDFFPEVEEGDGERSAVWTPRMDVTETETEFLVKMDLPGIEKKDLEVRVQDHCLVVSGERHEEKREERKNYLRMERSYGRFYRSFDLPSAVREDDVRAEMDNGVLMIHIPKTEESKPRRIEIA